MMVGENSRHVRVLLERFLRDIFTRVVGPNFYDVLNAYMVNRRGIDLPTAMLTRPREAYSAMLDFFQGRESVFRLLDPLIMRYLRDGYGISVRAGGLFALLKEGDVAELVRIARSWAGCF